MKLQRLHKKGIKEAFDNLPAGICFFQDSGMVVLCNRQMHRLVFALSGRDLQSLGEMQEILNGKINKGSIVRNQYILEDGSVWRFHKSKIRTEDGEIYTKVAASDVTELYHLQQQQEESNRKLAEQGKRLQSLTENIASVTREEEILNVKMRVHDDLGRSMIATRRLLKQNRSIAEIDLNNWKNAIRMLKHDLVEREEQNEYEKLVQAAQGIGLKICLQGVLPKDKKKEYLLLTVIRECATNAVRHARAANLYARISRQGEQLMLSVTCDGKTPQEEIVEGGGLSSLRMRVEKAGGRMVIKSCPIFEIRITIEEEEEEQM